MRLQIPVKSTCQTSRLSALMKLFMNALTSPGIYEKKKAECLTQMR